MNNFEKTFFKKYIPEGQEVKGVIHEHWIKIADNILIKLCIFTFVPTFLLYNSAYFQGTINFIYFEFYLILVYLKLIYDIFDWYNDVWIITGEGVVDLDWAIFKTSSNSVRYENIEGIGVEQDGIWDKILNKGDIIINKIGDDEFRLVDAKVPYTALNEIEKISNEIKENALAEKEDSERTKFELIIEALGGVVDEFLEEKSLDGKEILTRKRKVEKKSSKKDFSEEVVLEKGTIDLR